MQKDLTIIIPFYKGESHILTLLNSIKQSYQQTLINIEIIIILDSDIDDSCLQLIKRYELPIIVIANNNNYGVAKSRDIGISNATGKYVTFIDQDDFVSLEYFRKISKIISKEENDLLLLNGYLYNVKEKKRIPMFYKMPKFDYRNFKYINIIPSPSFLIIKKKFIEQHSITFTPNYYNKNTKGVDDWYLIFQLLAITNLKVKYLNSKIIYYCLHSSNFSLNYKLMLESKINILEYLRNKYPERKEYFEDSIRFCFNSYDFNSGKKKLSINKPYVILNFIKLYLIDYNRLIRIILKKFKNWRA